jgi:pimeloyl-ACP methyl ester carboxylesterase
MKTQRERQIKTTFGPMSFIESGVGPAMVFIHGWPMQKETFEPITRILSKNFRCISFDLIDIGNSRPATTPAPISFHQQVAALEEAITNLQLTQHTLVGQDSGGFIARLLAEANPKVTNLILFNTEIPGLIPPWVPFFQALAPLPFASQVFRACVSTRFIARSPMGFGGCFHDKDLIHGEFFSLTAKPLIENPEKLAGCIRFLKSMDWSECEKLGAVHQRITAKVDCIWGEDDPFFPVAEAQTMFEQFPNRGEFVSIKQAKLLPYAEHPEVSASYIERFVLATKNPSYAGAA